MPNGPFNPIILCDLKVLSLRQKFDSKISEELLNLHLNLLPLRRYRILTTLNSQWLCSDTSYSYPIINNR